MSIKIIKETYINLLTFKFLFVAQVSLIINNLNIAFFAERKYYIVI